MELIYCNYDGLDMSFQASAVHPVLAELEMAKRAAQETDTPVLAVIGPNKTAIRVHPGSMGRGYSFLIESTFDGCKWGIANSAEPNQWNIRFSSSSLALARHGLKGVKQHVFEFLACLGVDTTSPTMRHRVSRFDVCVDFMMEPGFKIDRGRFLMHSNMGWSTNGKGDEPDSYRFGKISGKQVAVYNKTEEIKEKGKGHWWGLWGIDPTEFDKPIWRVEVRAGKGALDSLNAKLIGQVESLAPAICADILATVRYITPPEGKADTNRSRWPNDPLWIETAEAIAERMERSKTDLSLDELYKPSIDARIFQRMKALAGMALSTAALGGDDCLGFVTVLDKVRKILQSRYDEDPDGFDVRFRQIRKNASLHQ